MRRGLERLAFLLRNRTPRDPVVTRIPNVYDRVGVNAILPYHSADVWSQPDMTTYAYLRSVVPVDPREPLPVATRNPRRRR